MVSLRLSFRSEKSMQEFFKVFELLNFKKKKVNMYLEALFSLENLPYIQRKLKIVSALQNCGLKKKALSEDFI